MSLDGSTVGETNDQGVIDVSVETAGNHTIEASADGLSGTATVTGVQPAPDETPTATATPTPTPTTEPSGAIGPGFGPVAALLALLAVAVLARRRR
ncbi:hypothetical protein BRC78_04760 [Halobacteriales archaeon QH_8_68_33]|nr:MAG: hypothetical protein BRC78_04760 [Halobacteriales archaeon QH_8_68_33]